MLRIAIKMLMGDGAKYAGLLFGIAFTSFLVTFAASYFCGFMTRGFALIAENPLAEVWVMNPTVQSVEQPSNMPASALARVRSTEGVASAVPLAVGTAEVRFPNGRFWPFQVIGIDDATLSGAPRLEDGARPEVLRSPDAVVVDAGGTSGKLDTALLRTDQWQRGAPRLEAPMRPLLPGDELLVNDRRVVVKGRSEALPRYPPRPLLYTTYSNAARVLLRERHRLSFVLATAMPGLAPRILAARIESRTGLKALTADEFKATTVRWFLANSEDVGDTAAMLILAMSVGFGVTAVMLHMFTRDHLKDYAVLKAMGVTPPVLIGMVFVQSGLCALIGSGLGLGLCALFGQVAPALGYPFRMMWFTPFVGVLMVVVVSIVAALISLRPVLKLEPAIVFVGR